MKIAVLSIGSFDTQYSDYHLMRDLILEFLSSGHCVELVQKKYIPEEIYPEQFRPYLGTLLTVHNIPFERKQKENLKARYLADLAYYRKACSILRKHPPDKIFLQSNNTAFYTVFYAKHILKKPVFYNEQDIFPENALFSGIIGEKSFVFRIAHSLQRYVYRNTTLLSTISDDMKETIVTRYKIQADKVQVIYNWGHEELKKQTACIDNAFLKKYPKRKNEFRVVYAGNLGKMQNVDFLLKIANVMKENKEISFYIVGDGSEKNNLQENANKNNLENVKFVDMQPPQEVADLYAASDLNVITLQPGIIHTALPSKIADCLIAQKPILFCFDEDSKFAKIASMYEFPNKSPMQPEIVASTILDMKIEKKKLCSKKFLYDYFNKEKNTKRYLDEIERMGEANL